MGRDSVLLTHGVDLEFWSQPKQGASVPELHQPGVERPLILFWGVIDRRMDGQFIEALCRADIGQVVLVGPQSDPAPELLQIPGLRLLPPQPLERLPGLAQQAAVLVMPYADLPVTRAIQPLKLKEYLATGRPCVVRDLPANRVWADCLDLADTADRFVEAVRLRIREGLPESQRQARQRLQHESWSEKARQFEQIIDE
jgi:glycosyltransferase involved in cell wall biosynthesis